MRTLWRGVRGQGIQIPVCRLSYSVDDGIYLNERGAVIDLAGVAPEHRGEGIGGKLVDAAVAHYANAAPRLSSGTQSRNIELLRLYQSGVSG